MRLRIHGLIFAGLTAFASVACAQGAAPDASTAPSATSTPYPSRVLRQTTFNIPFTVETARQPLEVQLYLSRDRGQTWKLYARQNPSARFFPFHATQDGEYWFASQTIDANRGAADIEGRQPELHVVIDTVQPQFDFRAAVGSSRQVQVSWRCSDPTIDPASLKIEYQAGREQPWQPVPAEPMAASHLTVSGQVTFVPQTAWVELQVRAEISDLAKNKAVVSRRLTLPTSDGQPNSGQQTWRPAAPRSPNDADRPLALPPTPTAPANVASSGEPGQGDPAAGMQGRHFPVAYGTLPAGFGPRTTVAPSTAAGIPVDPYANARPSQSDTPAAQQTTAPAPADAADVAPSTEWKSTDRPAVGESGFEGTSRPSGYGAGYGANQPLHELVQGNGYQPQPGQVHPLVSQQISPNESGARQEAQSNSLTSGQPSARPDLDATAPSPLRSDSNRVSITELRMMSAMRFAVDYEFDAAAANGARSVELWGTRDQGQTWSRWQVDDDRQSPLDVQVDAEGTFGFRIVIVGNNGLAGNAPRNGDDADLWVGIDTTAPVVRINTATYGEGEHAGQLDIRWTASDASFAENPISIFFSDNSAGPWTTIAAGIPNSGRYFWPIDPRIPEQLFLRIEARDRAGNQGEYRLLDSINLSGFTPKARIRGIRPVTNSSASDPSDLDSAPQATRNPYVYR